VSARATAKWLKAVRAMDTSRHEAWDPYTTRGAS